MAEKFEACKDCDCGDCCFDYGLAVGYMNCKCSGCCSGCHNGHLARRGECPDYIKEAETEVD